MEYGKEACTKKPTAGWANTFAPFSVASTKHEHVIDGEVRFWIDGKCPICWRKPGLP
jgi:hypothetical protein